MSTKAPLCFCAFLLLKFIPSQHWRGFHGLSALLQMPDFSASLCTEKEKPRISGAFLAGGGWRHSGL